MQTIVVLPSQTSKYTLIKAGSSRFLVLDGHLQGLYLGERKAAGQNAPTVYVVHSLSPDEASRVVRQFHQENANPGKSSFSLIDPLTESQYAARNAGY